MNPVFRELEEAVIEQHEHGEFPTWLAEPVLEVARNPERYAGREYLVELLAAQVKDYDVYGEAGCCKWAFDHEDVKRTLRWLEEGPD